MNDNNNQDHGTDPRDMSSHDRRKFGVTGRGVIATAALSGIGLAAAVTHDLFTKTFIPGLPTTLTRVSIAMLVAYTGRFLIHVKQGYVTWRPSRLVATRRRRRLNWLMAADAAGICAWAGLDAELAVHPLAKAIVVECVACWLAIWVLASETVDAAESLHLARGTEAILHCKLVRWTRRVMRRASPLPGVGTLYRRWSAVVRTDLISPFIVFIATLLIVMAASALPDWNGEPPTLGPSQGPTSSPSGGPSPARPSPTSPSTGVVPSPSPTSVQLPSPDTSYTAECGTATAPGDGAPPAIRAELHALWLGSKMLGIDGDGATQAGCATRAFQEPGRPSVWVETGICGTELRALAIVAPGYAPTLLYQQVADDVLGDVLARTLVGAYHRANVHNGDAVIVDTSAGSIGYLRQQKSRGFTQGATDPTLACARFQDGNVPYVKMPPGATGLWQTMVLATGTWLWPKVDSTVEPPAEGFEFVRDGNSSIVGRVDCSDDLHCSAVTGPAMSDSGGVFVHWQTLVAFGR
jgi:hypothetical protein